MPYLPPLSDEQAPEGARPLFGALQQRLGLVPNIFRTLGHAPPVLEAVLGLNQAIQKDLPPRYRELAYLKTSMLNACDY